MACHDNTNAFRLNARDVLSANDENLLACTKKCNVGSLKLPADPSWPKIPHRKLAEDAGDIIKPPYVVTLSGTPTSRTIIRTQYQTSKSVTTKDSSKNPTANCQKTTLTHALKKRPGTVDPRFKRVTTVKSQVAAAHTSERKHDILKDVSCATLTTPNSTLLDSEKLENTISQRDTNTQQVIQQEAEKRNEVHGIVVSNAHGMNSVRLQDENTLKNNVVTTECKMRSDEISKEPIREMKQTKDITYTDTFRTENNSHNVQEENLQTPVQKCKTGFSHNNADSNAQHSDTHKNRNVPDKFDQSKVQHFYSESESELCQNNLQQQGVNRKCSKYMLLRQEKYNSSYDETTDSGFHVRNSRQCTSTVDNIRASSAKNVTTNDSLVNHDKDMQQSRKTLQLDAPDTKHLRNEENNIIVTPSCRMKSQQNAFCEKLQPVKQHTQMSEPYVAAKQRRTAVNMSRKAKSFFQKNARCAAAGSDCTLIWPGSHHKQKCSEMNFAKCAACKKADNGEITSIQHFTHPTNLKDVLKLEVRQNSANKLQAGISSVSLNKQCCEQRDASHTHTDDSVDKPTKLSLKTQQLLNKNYWEYYNRLKHKLDNLNSPQQDYPHTAMSGPDMKKRKCANSHNDDQSTVTPEAQTLERCSILSTMINKTLGSAFHESSDALHTRQPYINGNVKSSSAPTGGTQSVVVKKVTPEKAKNVYEDSVLSSMFSQNMKYEAESTGDQRLLKLKTIIFFGSMMYALIVFLPMVYDYFFYEEYDAYQNMGYIELALEYVVSSFTEAFGGIFDVIDNTLLQPIRRKTRS